MAVRSTQGHNRPVRSTQGGEGCHPHLMHRSKNLQSSPLSVQFFCLCDKVHHKQEVCFLLYLLDHLTSKTLIFGLKLIMYCYK